MRCVLVLRKAEHPLAYTTTFQGIPLSIEHRAGSIRRGVDAAGQPWATRMLVPYGRLPYSRGADGDMCDVYVGPDKTAKKVYIIRAMQPPDFLSYEEDKCFLGFRSQGAAQVCFLQHYEDPRRMGEVITMDIDTFKRCLRATLRQPGAIAAL